MKRALEFAAKNWLTSLIGLAQMIGAGFAIWRDPTRLMQGDVLGTLFTGLVLLLARDPAKVQALIARASSPPAPTSGMDAANAERKN